MKLSILTTETLHHAYFVREVTERFPVARVFCETSVASAPFDTLHEMETAREQHESEVWFGGAAKRLSDFAETQCVPTLNDPQAIKSLAEVAPDVVLVFGTGRLKPYVVQIQPHLMLNLHGGDPQEYRGLDTHLWAIYHRDFANLVTTLHRVAPELDDGDIVLQGDLPVRTGLELHQLRQVNSEVCVKLALSALSAISANGDVPSHRQQRRGRYYSFMPTALKELCRQKFAAHTRTLET